MATAIAAGADQPLWSREQPLPEVIDTVVAAIPSGGISEDCIHEAVERI